VDVTTLKTIGLVGNVQPIFGLALSPDGHVLAVATGDNVLEIWDVGKRAIIKRLAGDHPPFQGHYFSAIVFDPAGHFLAGASSDQTIRIWNTNDWTERRLPGSGGYEHALGFSPDGTMLAASSGNGNDIQIWSTEGLQAIRNLSGHSSIINSVSFTKDGDHLLTSAGRELRMWDIKSSGVVWEISDELPIRHSQFALNDTRVVSTNSDDSILVRDSIDGQPIISFLTTSTDDFVLIRPDNYYRSTRNVEDILAFRKGTRAYPSEQFDLRLNRPDLVLERWGGASNALIAMYREAYKKRLDLMGVTEDQLSDNFHVPDLVITTQSLPVSTPDRILRFHIRASDTEQMLDRINVYVNGVPIYGRQGQSIKQLRRNTWDQDIGVELGTGPNKIQVSALNAGGAESVKQTVDVAYIGPTKPKPDLYVVAVGISRYKDKDANLNFAAKDATDQIQFWQTKTDRFEKIHALPIVNEDAVKENILSAKQFLMRADVDDEVVVSFAGHGLLDSRGEYYFGTADIDFKHPSRRGMPFESLDGLLDGLKARKKLLLIDTCQAGEVDKDSLSATAEGVPTGVGQKVTPGVRVRTLPKLRAKISGLTQVGQENSFTLQQQLFADLRRGSGTQIISASGGFEFAQEGGGFANGVFTAAVLEALRGADTNSQGVIKVSQLREYVERRVSEWTRGQQKPTARGENLDLDFNLW
jgi:uncharacterized caspase-like protein